MRFKYSYIIYKIYSWTANKSEDTPIANTILTLGLVHLFQLGILLLFIDRIVRPLNWLYHVNSMTIFMGSLVYFALFYFLIYNKERWNSYIQKYGNETESERRRGDFVVIAFLVGSVLLFFISLPVLFSIKKI